MTATNLRPFFPDIQPNKEFMLRVSELHEVYVASYGNEEGIPVIVLHGGPGAGTAPYYAQFFDPKKYRIILMDQRGAGKSQPKGEMRDNTTQDLIADIEKIRHLMGVDKWVVFGGSWGSTLGLLYAEAYSQHVLGMVLRGIFLVGEDDVEIFVRDGSPAALLHQPEWEKFKVETADLIDRAGLTHLKVGKDKIYHIYYELLTQPNQELKEIAAGTISAWEKFNSYLVLDEEELKWSRSPDGVNMGLTEATYFENKCFIRPNQIIDEIAALKGIPIHIVQGMYDLVCPPYMADNLQAALLGINADKSLIVRHSTLAGHSHKEPATRHAIIEALDQLADRLRPENRDRVTLAGMYSAREVRLSDNSEPPVIGIR